MPDQELDGLAYKTFGEVARSNPPYELEFASRIRQTRSILGYELLESGEDARENGEKPEE